MWLDECPGGKLCIRFGIKLLPLSKFVTKQILGADFLPVSSPSFTAVERGLRNPQFSPHLMGGDTEGWEHFLRGLLWWDPCPGKGWSLLAVAWPLNCSPENLPFGCNEQTCLPFRAFLSVSFISDYALGRPALLNLYGIFVSLF